MPTKHQFIISVEFLLLIFSNIYCGDAARGHKLSIQFQRAECFVGNKDIVQSFNCSLRRNDITKKLLLNTDLVLAKEVHDVKVRGKIAYELNGNSVKFFDGEVDYCKTSNHRYEFYLLRMINDEFRRRSNIPLKCPLKSNILYYTRNFTINAQYFPHFLPESKWSAYLNFNSENSVLTTLNTFGTIKRNKL